MEEHQSFYIRDSIQCLFVLLSYLHILKNEKHSIFLFPFEFLKILVSLYTFFIF